MGASTTLSTALNGRWRRGLHDEDDPPSVAVAASATQSFGSIIGCDLTRIFMDDTKKKPKKIGLSFESRRMRDRMALLLML